jgi:hypothetical protein
VSINVQAVRRKQAYYDFTQITKKLEIAIAPPVLTIHVKRFEDLHHKNNGDIIFEETIDLLT